ncbi:thiol S-methyltransferase METTL7B-like [Mercenaria mercenaria]|uniref:thiol S-methyltransferase METTL7B-like n=1 Tax=Mercenaria mercenaria TaxID=6596 RepID=UPI00234EFACD|nr:thiol S-methyltransferase METTL7B-like [Mercenaria mercenaria]
MQIRVRLYFERKMVMEDVESVHYLYEAGIFFAILGIVWYLRRPLSFHVLQRIYAWNINRSKSYSNVIWEENVRVFQLLNEYKQTINKNLTILDVGSGPAEYMAFFPDKTKLVCLDPNLHFAGYIKENMKKYENVVETDIVQGYAENMPFESERFDAAFLSLVLCVVEDVRKSLEEVMRVLKPGGKLVFLQHVTFEDKRLLAYVLQRAWVPFARMFYGCHATRDTVKSIRNAGFSDIHMQYIYPKATAYSLRKCVIGVATK